MFRKILSFGALLLTGAVLIAAAAPGQARGPGAAHFAGHYGGSYHGGWFYHGGYYNHPYSGYYHPYYGGWYHRAYGRWYYPYYYGYYYPYAYGYAPYPYAYYPSGDEYFPYYSPGSDDSAWYPGLYEAYSPGVNASGFTSLSPLSDGSQGPSSSGQSDTTARVTVRAPVGADIWVNGSNTYSAGPVREFRSPLFIPGYPYTYEFRAQWKNDDGREVSQTQQVTLTAGDHARVDFPIPDGTKARAPAAKGP